MRVEEALGFLRSWLIYRGQYWRAGAKRRLYAPFVEPGCVVFDVGAHVGDRVAAFCSLGARVVAVEPQPHLASYLRRRFRKQSVDVIEAALSSTPGKATLRLNSRNPAVSTTNLAWQARRRADPAFSGENWDRELSVDTTTLDHLIARFGEPSFVKIDAEGSELAVLKSCGSALRALSFEFLLQENETSRAVFEHLEGVGDYEYRCSFGESHRFAQTRWRSAAETLALLHRRRNEHGSGDIYARRK